MLRNNCAPIEGKRELVGRVDQIEIRRAAGGGRFA
jgi:hypothetical protein